jgi:hypothetical protein
MLKRILQIVVIALFVAFVAIQFVRPDLTNPPVVAGQTLEAIASPPENVQAILKRSCADCHSNTTVFPWYSQIAPVSWWLADHIREGRRELNFSEWGAYAANRKRRKLEEICEQVEKREMPLPSYLWAHRDAQMSDEEIKIICEWTRTEIEKIGSE